MNAVKSLKNNKTPGIDHIRNEDLRLLAEDKEDPGLLLGCKTALQIVFNMINTFWKNEKVPQDLKTSVLRPFLKDKNESEHDPGNYRPISLLNTFFKLYEA